MKELLLLALCCMGVDQKEIILTPEDFGDIERLERPRQSNPQSQAPKKQPPKKQSPKTRPQEIKMPNFGANWGGDPFKQFTGAHPWGRIDSAPTTYRKWRRR